MVADRIAAQQGLLACREVFVTGKQDGKRVYGFLDVYNVASNTYYEIKSEGVAYTSRTISQMNKYDCSRPILSTKGTVKRGMEYMEGSFHYGAWEVTYHTDPNIAGLVTYNYKYIPERSETAKEVTTGVLLAGAIAFTLVTLGAGSPALGVVALLL